MLSIYNETKSPWILDIENEKVIAFSKQQKFTKDNVEKTAYIKINGSSYLLDGIGDIESKSNAMVNMTDVETLVNKPMNLSFKRKNFKPFITSSDTDRKNILLLSFNLYRSKVVKTSGSGFFVLEGLIKANTFNLILVFNNPEAVFSIQVYNISKKQTETHTFTKSGDKIVKTFKVVENIELDIDSLAYRVRPTRPSKPTHTVLVSEYDNDTLIAHKSFKNDPKVFNKVIIHASPGSLQTVIDNLLNERISAVTFFVNDEKKNERFYSMVLTNLMSNFSLVYQLSSKGIKKLKVF